MQASFLQKLPTSVLQHRRSTQRSWSMQRRRKSYQRMFLTKGTFDVRVDNTSLKKNRTRTENRTRSLMQLSRQQPASMTQQPIAAHTGQRRASCIGGSGSHRSPSSSSVNTSHTDRDGEAIISFKDMAPSRAVRGGCVLA